MDHRVSQGLHRATFDQESNIHVLASALDGFFKDLYKQPASTWIDSLKEGMLVPFVTRPDPPTACLFGERNPKASALIHEERPQNWLSWFLPLLTHDDGKSDVLKPSYSVGGVDKMESIWSIGLLLTISCLHWAFSNRPPEVFVNLISDVRKNFEQLGWDELNCARVRRILSALVAKVSNSKAYVVKTDSQQLKFLENVIALCAVVEDFVFFSPLFGFNTKPDIGICGLHSDQTGLLDADLLKSLYECIQQHGQTETKTVIQSLDRKDIKEFKRRSLILDEIKQFLQVVINWSVSASNFLSRKSERAWVAGRADGLHVAVGDRVLVKQNKQGDLMATVAYKGNPTTGASVGGVGGVGGGGTQLGVVFDGPMGGSNGVFNGKQLFTCAEGCGALVRPENAFSQEDVAGKQEYERLATAVIEGMSKRPYFRGNKKQIRECFDEVLRPNRKVRNGANKKSLGSTTLSATFADVPYEVCLEQMKTGAYSLRRMVRYLTKIQEAKTAYLALLDKVNLEEGGKHMSDQMELFVEGQKAVTHFEHAMGNREKQLLIEVQNEVILPFQALEKDYESAVNHFKLQHTAVEKTIENGQLVLSKELAECEKELQDIRRLKFDVDAGKKTGGDLAKYTKQLQSAAAKVAQYDAASQRFKDETYVNLRKTQKQLRIELQAAEQKRLLSTQVFLQRYLSACETLTSPYPQLTYFSSLVADLTPSMDISIFVAINRRPEIEYYVQKTSCSASDVMIGNLSTVAPLSPQNAPPSPIDFARSPNTMVPPLSLNGTSDSPTAQSRPVSSRPYRSWGRSTPSNSMTTSSPSFQTRHSVPSNDVKDSSNCSSSGGRNSGSYSIPHSISTASRASSDSDSSCSSSHSFDSSNHSTRSNSSSHNDSSQSNNTFTRTDPIEVTHVEPAAPSSNHPPLPESPRVPPSEGHLSSNGSKSPDKPQARSVVGLSQAMKGPSRPAFGSSQSFLALSSLPTSAPCSECKCMKFSPSFVKKARCSNCSHVHVHAPKLEA